MLRTSALAGTAIKGRFGADKGAPGVTFTVIHPVTMAMVIARKDKAKALKDALGAMEKVEVFWAGPEQYYVYNAPYSELKKKLGAKASVSDQSHGRLLIRIRGPKVRALLAKGTPVDLHSSEFAIGKSVLTQMAHVSVHLSRTGADEFMVSVFRGFSESFWEWLTSQAGEFGYDVK
jgi:methylglutamate dehydrogenase subunit D